MEGTRHLIQCHCILPQFRKNKDPIFHKFVVFSILDEEKNVIPKFSQCNNCSAIHKITDLCKSEIVHNIDTARTIIDIQDIKRSLTSDIISLLDSHNCDISIWENVKFILDNERWGETVILAKDEISGTTQVKILTIKSENKIKVESHIRQDEILGVSI